MSVLVGWASGVPGGTPGLYQGASCNVLRLSWESGGTGMNWTVTLGGNTTWLLDTRHSVSSPVVSPILAKPLVKGVPETPHFHTADALPECFPLPGIDTPRVFLHKTHYSSSVHTPSPIPKQGKGPPGAPTEPRTSSSASSSPWVLCLSPSRLGVSEGGAHS